MPENNKGYGLDLSGLSEDELFRLTFCGERLPIEELRRRRRALAESRGTTLEEELDEFERYTGSRTYVNVLREILGIEPKDS